MSKFYFSPSKATESSLRSILNVLDSEQNAFSSLGLNNLELVVSEFKANAANPSFNLGVVGRFSCGKSSFINTLIELEGFMPTHWAPITPMIVRVRYDKSFSLKLRDSSSEKIIERKDFKTISKLKESLNNNIQKINNANHKTGKSVPIIEVGIPSVFLEDGVVLVDTPGILAHDIKGKVHEEIAMSEIEKLDGIIFMISPENQLSADLLPILKRIKERNDNLLLLINKADQLDEIEDFEDIQDFSAEHAGLEEDRVIGFSSLNSFCNNYVSSFVYKLDKYILKGNPKNRKASIILNSLISSFENFSSNLEAEIYLSSLASSEIEKKIENLSNAENDFKKVSGEKLDKTQKDLDKLVNTTRAQLISLEIVQILKLILF